VLNFVRNSLLPSRPAKLFTQTAIKWQKDKCLEMGAALAYYALFSLFPILLVLLGVVGFLLGPDSDGFAQIIGFVEGALPPEALDIVKTTLLQLNQRSVRAGVTGSCCCCSPPAVCLGPWIDLWIEFGKQKTQKPVARGCGRRPWPLWLKSYLPLG
jgi:hypothetical protein